MVDEEVETTTFELSVGHVPARSRLDAYLAGRFPDYSRTFIKKLIDEGRITVNAEGVKPSYAPRAGDRIVARVPMLPREAIEPEDIPLDIIYEDEWLIVINKPPDMVVHPSRGHQSGTLVNAVAHHCRELSQLGGALRPGIVHRLDRDTSGVILMIKDGSIHEQIARQFEKRETRKEYTAICEGRFELDSDVVDAPIGPHPRAKEKMAVRYDRGKPARTTYEVIERLNAFSVVRCIPYSGRTHQIRVHMKHVGHPIVCDSQYGHHNALYPSDLSGEEQPPAEEPLLQRQGLHARRLGIFHPGVRRQMCFEAPVAEDMMALVEALRRRADAH